MEVPSKIDKVSFCASPLKVPEIASLRALSMIFIESPTTNPVAEVDKSRTVLAPSFTDPVTLIIRALFPDKIVVLYLCA